MTHSLHRIGTESDLKKDYVILAMVARGFNDLGTPIIDGTVFAKELLLPELGQCGSPYLEQLVWLKEKIHRSIIPQKENNLSREKLSGR